MGASTLADIHALDPVEFERLVGTVFTALGYEVAVTKRSGDEGIDLELRRGTERSLAQCKRYRGTVGQPAVRDFYGVAIHASCGHGQRSKPSWSSRPHRVRRRRSTRARARWCATRALACTAAHGSSS